VSANQADANNALSVRGMCRVLQVSPSGYYDWLRRPPSARMLANLVLTEAIRKVHKDSDETYGMPRVRAELREAGHAVSRKRVAHLMRKACIRGVSRPAWFHGDDRARSQATPRARSGQSALPRRSARPAVGGRHDLYPDVDGLPVPGRGGRYVQPQSWAGRWARP